MISKNAPTTSVIIVTHNSQRFLPKAMHCLKMQTLPPTQIVIVDSGSKETEYLEPYQKEKNVVVVLAGNDIGFCKGNNIGMSKIPRDCDYVFFLNPDAFLTPKYIEGAIAYMQDPENQQCGMLTGTLLGYDINADRPTGKYDSTGVFRKWYGHWYDRGQGKDAQQDLYSKIENLPAICGAAMFCRKRALDTVLIREGEVLDSTFFMYKEDIDLAIRLRRKGWKLIFVPNLIAYHCRGWNWDRKQIPREFRLHSARNELRIHYNTRSPMGCLYSLLKYTMVKTFDI